ncbi:MAG: folate-binding protein [Pseudomonadota bacterium]
MKGETAEDRVVLQISGDDRVNFLQGLVTNDLARLDQGLVYAALLSPQGKYLADFFLCDQGDAILLDIKADLAPAVLKRLTMYKLRADVTIAAIEMPVLRGLGTPPEGALADPRDPALGWRYYGPAEAAKPEIDWDTIRVDAAVPESGIELVPDESYILEMDFERLHGVDFKKGCYVGQEVTARMKHKTELRKGLARVSIDGTAPVGTQIMAGGKPVGTLYTQAHGKGLAYLRLDRAKGEMQAGDATLTRTVA